MIKRPSPLRRGKLINLVGTLSCDHILKHFEGSGYSTSTMVLVKPVGAVVFSSALSAVARRVENIEPSGSC